MLTLILLTFVIAAAAVLAMAIGTIFSGRCLRGSCGGAEVFGPDGESLTCERCPLRSSREGYEPQGSLPHRVTPTDG